MELPNDLAFARAARSYYEAVTGLGDWRQLSPDERATWRGRLRREAAIMDRKITEEALRQP